MSYSHSGTQPLSTQVDLVAHRIYGNVNKNEKTLTYRGLFGASEQARKRAWGNGMEYDDLRAMADSMGVVIEERRLSGGLCGMFYQPRKLIVLDESLSPVQRRCTLCHELVHASFRDEGCGDRWGVKCERRTRRETALRLIDPVSYASAERVFEGDAFQMSAELGVTAQVLADYRQLLQDTLVLPDRTVDWVPVVDA